MTLTEIDETLTALAYIVLKHGEKYAPLMERMVLEREKVQCQVSASDRARQILAAAQQIKQISAR